MKSRGRWASAAQIATRCCCPPDSSPGRASLVEQADALEQGGGGAVALGRRRPEQPETEPDELACAQLRRERARSAGRRSRASASGSRPARRLAACAGQHRQRAHDSRGRLVEPGEDAQQRALAGPARPEDDQLTLPRRPPASALECDRRPFRRRVDAKRSVASTAFTRRPPRTPPADVPARDGSRRARRLSQRSQGQRARLRRQASRTRAPEAAPGSLLLR